MTTQPFAAACLAAVFWLLPLSASAQVPPPEKTISMDVSKGDLHAVVPTLVRQTQVQARVQDGKKPFKPIYVHLEDASLSKALKTIALSAGADVTKNTDGVYVFTPLDGSVLPLPSVTHAAGPAHVAIQVAFVSDSLADLASRGLQFTALPVAVPDGSSWPLQMAHGEAVTQLYHSLSQTHGMIQVPTITTNNGVATGLSVNTQLLLPPSTQLSPFEASLTFIPRINSDGTVTLETQTGPRINLIAPLNFDAELPHLLLTVGSGDMIVICSPFVEPGKRGEPYYSDGSPSRTKPYADQAMLIFITPTIISSSIDVTLNSGQSVTITP